MLLLIKRSGRLASTHSVNLLMYPISDGTCHRPERGVLVIQNIFLQNNLFIFNLLSACLKNPTHPSQNHKPQIHRYPPPYDILLLFLLYFCATRRYFCRSSLCQLIYKQRETKKIPRDSLLQSVDSP